MPPARPAHKAPPASKPKTAPKPCGPCRRIGNTLAHTMSLFGRPVDPSPVRCRRGHEVPWPDLAARPVALEAVAALPQARRGDYKLEA